VPISISDGTLRWAPSFGEGGARDAPESFGAAGDDGALAIEVERRALADHIVPKGPLT
jgi:hypothetical protein